ncbi:MAG: hypothetical protein LBV40_08285, partial [Methanomicrobiales archaeon]|nr:hypothetical protein [Methanomicrobiales archaeon]
MDGPVVRADFRREWTSGPHKERQFNASLVIRRRRMANGQARPRRAWRVGEKLSKSTLGMLPLV